MSKSNRVVGIVLSLAMVGVAVLKSAARPSAGETVFGAQCTEKVNGNNTDCPNTNMNPNCKAQYAACQAGGSKDCNPNDPMAGFGCQFPCDMRFDDGLMGCT